jgi:hypothetical protein
MFQSFRVAPVPGVSAFQGFRVSELLRVAVIHASYNL